MLCYSFVLLSLECTKKLFHATCAECFTVSSASLRLKRLGYVTQLLAVCSLERDMRLSHFPNVAFIVDCRMRRLLINVQCIDQCLLHDSLPVSIIRSLHNSHQLIKTSPCPYLRDSLCPNTIRALYRPLSQPLSTRLPEHCYLYPRYHPQPRRSHPNLGRCRCWANSTAVVSGKRHLSD